MRSRFSSGPWRESVFYRNALGNLEWHRSLVLPAAVGQGAVCIEDNEQMSGARATHQEAHVRALSNSVLS
jgi:hypothetical protein